MVRLLASLAEIAQARLTNAGRRVRWRAGLIAATVIAGLIAAGFAVGAATVGLAHLIGTVGALLVMACLALVVVLILLGTLTREERRHRVYLMRREGLGRQFTRAAASSVMPRRAPSRPVFGLALVALGALLVLARRGDDD